MMYYCNFETFRPLIIVSIVVGLYVKKNWETIVFSCFGTYEKKSKIYFYLNQIMQ